MERLQKIYTRINQHKVELSKISELIAEQKAYHGKIFLQANQFRDQLIALSNSINIKYDPKLRKELEKVQQQVEALGLAPDQKLDFTIMDAYSAEDAVGEINAAIKKVNALANNLFQGMDISGYTK